MATHGASATPGRPQGTILHLAMSESAPGSLGAADRCANQIFESGQRRRKQCAQLKQYHARGRPRPRIACSNARPSQGFGVQDGYMKSAVGIYTLRTALCLFCISYQYVSLSERWFESAPDLRHWQFAVQGQSVKTANRGVDLAHCLQSGAVPT